MKLLFSPILAFLLLNPAIHHAQKTFQWIAGTGTAYSIINTTGGGIVVAGSALDWIGSLSEDFYMAELDSNGSVIWSNMIDMGAAESFRRITPVTGGGYAGFGYLSLPNGVSIGYVVKTDAMGNVDWIRAIGDTLSNATRVRILDGLQTPDGGYLAIGRYDSMTTYGCIVKLDAGGNLEWVKTVGEPGNNYELTAIVPTNDNGFMVTGRCAGPPSLPPGANLYFMNLDAAGNLRWTRTISDSTEYLIPYAAIQAADGGFVVAGITSGSSFGYALYAAKLDNGGGLEWTRSFSSLASPLGFASIESIVQADDGGYVMAGTILGGAFSTLKICILKLGPGGDLIWAQTIGGTGGEAAFSITKTPDGGYMVGGTTNGSFGSNGCYIVKLNRDGQSCAHQDVLNLESHIPRADTGSVGSLKSISVRNSLVTGIHSDMDSASTVCVPTSVAEIVPGGRPMAEVFPNPATGFINVQFHVPQTGSLMICDPLGRVVGREKLAESRQVRLNLETFQAGRYHLVVHTSGSIFRSPFMVAR